VVVNVRDLPSTSADDFIAASRLGSAAGIDADGITGADWVEYGLGPAALVARTAKTYAVPFVRPVTVLEVPVTAEPGVQVDPPLDEYSV
jgi:hypothetical protein